jgi:hypothetical protein
MVMGNGEEYAGQVSQGCHSPLDDSVDSDSQMSVERFDDAAAAFAFAATVITITLGFLFNL